MSSLAEENYLKAIYKIAESGDGYITTNDIARKMSTTAASVTDMLKKLAAKKLIKYKKYYGLTLTSSGSRAAVEVIRRHRLWEMFLVKVLGFRWDEVHEVAEQLEHIRSEKLIRHIDKLLNFPKIDPHGDPIPDSNGKFALPKLRPFPLSESKEGMNCSVSGVADHSRSFLQLLDKSGIGLGARLKVKSIQPYDRSLAVLLNGKKPLFLSSQIAKNILVTHGSKSR